MSSEHGFALADSTGPKSALSRLGHNLSGASVVVIVIACLVGVNPAGLSDGRLYTVTRFPQSGNSLMPRFRDGSTPVVHTLARVQQNIDIERRYFRFYAVSMIQSPSAISVKSGTGWSSLRYGLSQSYE